MINENQEQNNQNGTLERLWQEASDYYDDNNFKLIVIYFSDLALIWGWRKDQIQYFIQQKKAKVI